MSEKLHLIFHVEGQFTSPANYRAVNLAKSCSHFGCRVAILADDRNDNKRFVDIPLSQLEIIFIHLQGSMQLTI